MIWDYCENSEIMYIRGPALDGHRVGINSHEFGCNHHYLTTVCPYLTMTITNLGKLFQQVRSRLWLDTAAWTSHPSNSTEPALDTGWLKAWLFNLN